MITALVVSSIVTFVGGLLIGRPVDKRHRCGAHGSTARWNYLKEKNEVETNFRCKEKADPRCEAGYCTVHCRMPNRCDSACLKARESLLKNT